MRKCWHLGEVLPGQVVLEGGQALDRHLHVVGVHVDLVHGDLLPLVLADNVDLGMAGDGDWQEETNGQWRGGPVFR